MQHQSQGSLFDPAMALTLVAGLAVAVFLAVAF